jgi:acetolactate synthase-1/2/3 large subunit/N2-(2-carboxyethyl)arginine synthase
MMKGSEIFLNTLKARGLTTIYGIVGREAEVIMFDEVKGLDFILTRDERSAAFMADMQGRLTGKAGVCYSTFGPGSTNLATGVASAYTDRAPLLAVSAQVEKDSIHSSTHQCVDQASLMKPIVKYSKEVTDIKNLEKEILRAVVIAESGLPGPCFLSVPLDLFKQEGIYEGVTGIIKTKDIKIRGDRRIEALDKKKNSLSDFSSFLSGCRHPVCIVGSNIFDEKEKAALTELLNCLKVPVVVTYSGKRSLSCFHNCYLGTVSKYLDSFTPGVLSEIFHAADSVILIGLDMVEGVDSSLWRYGKKKKICAINSILKYSNSAKPVDLILFNPLKDIVDYLKANLEKKFFSLNDLNQAKKRIEKTKDKVLKNKRGLCAFGVVEIINKVLVPDDIVVSDVGIHKQLMSLYYQAKKPNRFFCSNGLGSMGFGLPAAIGAKKTFPTKRVVTICGDGGFHLSSHELETTIRYHLPVVCLIFHDASVGLIRHYQKKGFDKTNSGITDFGKIDFVKLAEANGCKGCRVFSKNQLRVKLKKALDADTTTVIEIPLKREEYIF